MIVYATWMVPQKISLAGKIYAIIFLFLLFFETIRLTITNPVHYKTFSPHVVCLLHSGVEHCWAVHWEILYGIHPRVPPLFPHSFRSGPAPITTETGQAGVTEMASCWYCPIVSHLIRIYIEHLKCVHISAWLFNAVSLNRFHYKMWNVPILLYLAICWLQFFSFWVC